MSHSYSPNHLNISRKQVKHNLQALRSWRKSPAEMLVIVKADGYGMGAVELAHMAQEEGCAFVGVAYLDEALHLREHGIHCDILVLNSVPDHLELLVKSNFHVVISSLEKAEDLARFGKIHQKVAKVHLQVNTGMGRFGCQPEEALSIAKKLWENPWISLEGITTHLSMADLDTQMDFTDNQIASFHTVVQNLKQNQIHPRWVHAANSAGHLYYDLSFCNLIRLGIACYGFIPAPKKLNIAPAISLESQIICITALPSGSPVGYGGHFVTKRELSRIAIVSLGYHDGLHRNYREAEVLVNGKKAPIVGNICMDNMMVDVSDHPNVNMGDPVLIFGKDSCGNYLCPMEFAKKSKTIPHELMATIGPRVKRNWI